MEFEIRKILLDTFKSSKDKNDLASNELIILFKKEAEMYGEFLVMSERLGLKLLSFHDYKTKLNEE